MISHLFSCEYATCAVPAAHMDLFAGHKEMLSSSAGWNPGALNLAQAFAMRFRTPLVHSEVSRLLVDVEEEGEGRFSAFSASLSEFSVKRLSERYWETYRSQLLSRIHGDLNRHGEVLHVMVHTADRMQGHVLLETPAGGNFASQLARSWVECMKRDGLRVKHEVIEDASPLFRDLSGGHPPGRYGLLRLSVNQDFFLTGLPWRWATIKKHLLDSLVLSSGRMGALRAL